MSTATSCPPRVSGRTDPEVLCAPSTDTAGFIYPSYQAADTQAQRDGRPLETSHQDVAHVSTAVGGSLSTLSFEETTKNQWCPPKRRGGGIRDTVRGFSRASRRNLLRRLASINRRVFRALKGRMVFVTLTYPHEYPEDPERCKGHLKALRKRLHGSTGRSQPSGGWVSSREARGISTCSCSWDRPSDQ